jgi:cellulose synthase operon protein YhjQ
VKILTVVSAKGGVGKTTVAANLSAALSRIQPVVSIDLDPQNALRLHLGVGADEIDGVGRCTLEGRSWDTSLFKSPSGAHVLPYGALTEPDRDAFEVYLSEHPTWLTDGLNSLRLAENDFVVVDTPPGPSLYLQQALRAAHYALVVIHADAASYATLPAMEGLLLKYCTGREGYIGSAYLMNNVHSDKVLTRDVVDIIRARFGDRVVPFVVHQDEAVREALAYDRVVIEYDPHCEATHDIANIANWLSKQMRPSNKKSESSSLRNLLRPK